MNQNKNQTKKKTLLDDFNEIEEFSKKQNYETHFQSEFSESNTINADTESVSKMNTSRQPDIDFMDDLQSANQYASLKQDTKQTKKIGALIKNQAPSGNTSQISNRNHAPQIIDEDTEHFKVKIEHLLNVFKTDAISEFMGMKRSMLEDQRSQVKNQTERYLSMYEDKHKEQTETNEKLEEQMRINTILKERLEKMSAITQKAKSKFHIQKSLQYFFTSIKNYKKYKIEQKKKKKLAQVLAAKNLKLRVFSAFIKVCRESKHAADLQNQEKHHLVEIDEISNKFNKEMAQLKEQLQETQVQLQQIHVTKESMQENLKKAFMRGVCALNFEAMNAIQGTPQGFNPETFLNAIENGQQQKMNNVSQTTSTVSQSFVASNASQQQQFISQQQQQQQQFNQNETALIQSIVQKNPQAYSSMLINTADTNSYAIQNQQSNLSTQNFSANPNPNISNNNNNGQFNSQNAFDSLEQERITQIEFLKKELEQIQKIAGNIPQSQMNQFSQRQQMEQEHNHADSNNNYMQDAYNDEDEEEQNQPQQQYQQQKKIVIFQESKAESKDHRWKNAPVVGLPNKAVNNNNKENNFLQNTSSLPNFMDQQSSYNYEDECKVIRVNTSSKEFQNTTNKIDKATIKPNAKPPVKEPLPQKSFPTPTNGTATSQQSKSSLTMNQSSSGKAINNSNNTVKSNIGTTSKNTTKTSTKK